MSTMPLRMSKLTSPLKTASLIISPRLYYPTRSLTTLVDSHFISQITAAEKLITKQDEPLKSGPTARAQSHAGGEVTSQVVHDITMGERTVTGLDSPAQGGSTSIAQQILAQAVGATAGGTQSASRSGVLDSEAVSKITEKEKDIIGSSNPVKNGPTAKAERYVGEPINSRVLHDITGE
ncbi:hypothetical protein BU24DRAFT_474193 [Aaosphaeria arxii CBS 175.79]|uniref:SMP domain-containing protein n=1 Tax=Aaosphaeria arxii CBS 175.79 TaxID=1450172 RepID=A0A6A5X8A1_9PLEO|nr:uncharacterized protein BU24DRAFT_474193 [Aaosphaeria arxii CBS 175.79]KAF2009275.1 hypothetical protein BU24DRAFT_474193 [Aaosphaeria arxii CBS 175.79]